MRDKSWYEVVETKDLEQGDILRSCPVYWIEGVSFPPKSGDPASVVVAEMDLAVLTQTCDLVQQKVDEIMVGEVISYDEVKVSEGEFVASSKFRQALVAGNVPGYSLLQKHEAQPELPWSLVDFHRIHVLPKAYVQAFLATNPGPRLRLLSPYKEHLSQAFARYFMRVGLPHDAQPFVNEGKA